MTRKYRKRPKNKTGKERVFKRKDGATTGVKLRGKDISAVPARERINVQPYNPVRALLSVATRTWELSLIQDLFEGRPKGKKSLPDLNKLAQGLRVQDLRHIATLEKKIKHFLGSAPSPPSPPPSIGLRIEGIEPAMPSSWAPQQDVRVGFVLQNNSTQPTSGMVHGSAAQNVVRTLVSSRWFQPGEMVNNLPPGQAFIGVLELKNWTAYDRLPGSVDISLEYWVEDPNGTITFVWGLPNWHEATYNAISFAQGSYGAPTSFANDIRPLFRDKDIQAMRNTTPPIDLASYQDVKSHAAEIYNSLAHPTPALSMPCDGRWQTDWIDTFKLWMDVGMLP